jgi:hypothetical protein
VHEDTAALEVAGLAEAHGKDLGRPATAQSPRTRRVSRQPRHGGMPAGQGPTAGLTPWSAGSLAPRAARSTPRQPLQEINHGHQPENSSSSAPPPPSRCSRFPSPTPSPTAAGGRSRKGGDDLCLRPSPKRRRRPQLARNGSRRAQTISAPTGACSFVLASE